MADARGKRPGLAGATLKSGASTAGPPFVSELLRAAALTLEE